MENEFGVIAVSMVSGAVAMRMYMLLNQKRPAPQTTTPEPDIRISDMALRNAVNQYTVIDNTTKINGKIFHLCIIRDPYPERKMYWIRSTYRYFDQRGDNPDNESLGFEQYVNINTLYNSRTNAKISRDMFRNAVITHLELYANHNLSVDSIARIYNTALDWVDDIGKAEKEQ